MNYVHQKDCYVLRLEKGEEIVASVKTFAQQHELGGAFMYGLGGALSAQLAMYLLDEQRYETTDFSGPLEIASLTGNIARKADGEIMLHCHAVISGRDLQAYAGHLTEAVVGGTVEIFIDCRPHALQRTHYQSVGLALLNLCDNDAAE